MNQYVCSGQGVLLREELEKMVEGRVRTYSEFKSELVDLGVTTITDQGTQVTVRRLEWRTKFYRDGMMRDFKIEIRLPVDNYALHQEAMEDALQTEIYKAYMNYLHIVCVSY